MSNFVKSSLRKTHFRKMPHYFPVSKKRKKTNIFFRFLLALIGIGVLAGVGGIGYVYFAYFRDMPSITDIEKNILPESTIIYDRNGKELYKLFSKEKRTYVPYAAISPRMIDAIVSIEDKTFFENPGIDLKWLARSAYNYIAGKTEQIKGTSTLSQQLIKNMLFSNERSYIRKIKEVYLSYQLNQSYSKEKILELYLNKISYGNNAYGIEEAAKTYFGKSAKDLGVLGSAILASIPKWPTYYSPYKHRDRLMGSVYVYAEWKPNEIIKLESPDSLKTYRPFIDAFKSAIQNLEIKRSGNSLRICGLNPTMLSDGFRKKTSIDSQSCATLSIDDFLNIPNSLQIRSKDIVGVSLSWSLSGTILEFTSGRKDFVALRMFDDGKIDQEELKKVIVGGIDFTFRKYSENIVYPHFIFYVKDYLDAKYGKTLEEEGGFKIYTTIDSTLQDKAEEILKKKVEDNIKRYDARDAALVSMDNTTGQILAMVGGIDYFNDERDGNVNMITSRRQPGSSFKPIVYSLAISKNPIGPETPIYDVDTTFNKWNPDNYDSKFLGLMPIKKALDYSRNIPAIKMFYLAWGEDAVVEYARSLGILSVKKGASYGAPLAIGTGEMKPIELLQAYSVFANRGYRKDPVSVLKIVDKKGNVIEEYRDTAGNYVLPETVAYIMSLILSDASSRPGAFWNDVLTLKGRPVAAKTGTSNMVINPGKNEQILPRDLWTAGYTPQMTTVVWAGNIDGKQTKGTCDGLNCAAPIWHDYMEFAHKNLPVLEFKQPEWLFRKTISRTSGRLVNDGTGALIVSSLFAVEPTQSEPAPEVITYDVLCHGRVNSSTPADAQKTGLVLDLNPVIDSYDPRWLTSVYAWAKSPSGAAYFQNAGSLVMDYKDEPCVRPKASISPLSVNINIHDGQQFSLEQQTFEISYKTTNAPQKIIVTLDGQSIQEIPIAQSWSNEATLTAKILFDKKFAGKHSLWFRLLDNYYYTAEKVYSIEGIEDVSGPEIHLINPVEWDQNINVYSNQFFNLRFSVDDASSRVAIRVSVDGVVIKTFSQKWEFTIPINENSAYSVGPHTLTIEAADALKNQSRKNLTFEVLP